MFLRPWVPAAPKRRKLAIDPARWAKKNRAAVAEIATWLNQKFDWAGYRLISREQLCEAEWNFSGIGSLNVIPDSMFVEAACEQAYDYELARESPQGYKFALHRLLVRQGDMALAAFKAKWQIRPTNCADLFGFGVGCPFPTPWMLTPEDFRTGLTVRHIMKWGGPAVVEITNVHSRQLRFPRIQLHLEIYLDKGIQAVKDDVWRLVRSKIPAGVPVRRERPKRQRIEDGLAELACVACAARGSDGSKFQRNVRQGWSATRGQASWLPWVRPAIFRPQRLSSCGGEGRTRDQAATRQIRPLSTMVFLNPAAAAENLGKMVRNADASSAERSTKR
jgi:hypothetical protein